jgi:hypothetical protein
MERKLLIITFSITCIQIYLANHMISSHDTKQQNSHAIAMLYSGSPTEFSA